MTGTFLSSTTFGSTTLTSRGNRDVFIMHVTSAGTIDWAVQAGGEVGCGGKELHGWLR